MEKTPPVRNYMAAPGLLSEDILISIVCREYKVNPSIALGQCRKRELVEPRQVIATLALELLSKPVTVKGKDTTRKWTLNEIGMLFNPPKDHATVLHSRRVITDLCETNKAFNSRFQNLREKLLWLGQYALIKNPVVNNSEAKGNNSEADVVEMAIS